MNEVLFFAHILAALIFLGVAVRLGSMALAAFIALSGVLANLFVVKQMNLFGLQVTCSDVYAIGGILGLNLLQELYGKEAANRAIRSSIFVLLLFVLMSQIHLLYSPGEFDGTHAAFSIILGQSPRIVAASVGVYYLVQKLDVLFFTFLKRWIENLGTRLMLSLFISQALDTVLFSFFGLYGLVASLFDVIVVSLIVKYAIILCSSHFAALFKRYLWKAAA
ncbi:MAG: conserved putative rane protein [Parachlamydiales bacterium]|nr:conserved putative rane protein [Parachlamydiales bacterium]